MKMFDQQAVLLHARRRSVDVGGLSHAMQNPGLGHGWGGWDDGERGEVRYAELLSDMYLQTKIAVDENRCESTTSSLPEDARANLIKSVSKWNFEPHKLPDEEVISCTMIIFETLFRIEGMHEYAGVSLTQISNFVEHLRRIYRVQNSYHNFHHALDVLQATYHFLCSAGLVPSVRILLEGNERRWKIRKTSSGAMISCLSINDILALHIAAIGHDVGHPGFTNNFMKNAKTPLSVVYDDKSALEHMHCALLIRVMRDHGLGDLLDRPDTGTAFRKLLQCSVLATDMSVHADFMTRFGALVSGGEPCTLDQKKVLLCQALIKCADISNPSRPHRVSQYWAGALMEEWTCQATLERHFHLPVSVSPAVTPVAEAMSQVWFINAFAKPLLDLAVQAIPQLKRYSRQCATNLKIWQERIKVGAETQMQSDAAAPPNASQTPSDFLNAFPLTLPPSLIVGGEEWTFLVAPSCSSSDASSVLTRSPDVRTVEPGSQPTSPCELAPSLLLPPSPQSDVGSIHNARPGSSCGNDTTTALRTAYQASARKKRSLNRNSWNVSPIASGPESPVGQRLKRREVMAGDEGGEVEGDAESCETVGPDCSCLVDAPGSVEASTS